MTPDALCCRPILPFFGTMPKKLSVLWMTSQIEALLFPVPPQSMMYLLAGPVRLP